MEHLSIHYRNEINSKKTPEIYGVVLEKCVNLAFEELKGEM